MHYACTRMNGENVCGLAITYTQPFIWQFIGLVHLYFVITGPPNGPVLFCSLASVVCGRCLSSVVFCNTADGQAERSGGWAADIPRRASSVTSR